MDYYNVIIVFTMSQEDKLAALILERKENLPQKDTIIQAKIIAINTNGLYLDINKSFEAYISQKELSENTENYKVGDTIEAYVLGEDKNQSGIFRLSTKQIDAEKKWQKLEELLNQELEVRISKAVKSGLEVTIVSTEDLAFIPNSCLDAQAVALRNQKPEQWIGTTITARLQEIDRSKNKIILNHKLVSERLKQENFAKVFSSLEIGQNLDLEIIRLAEFGAFVDINGVDALVPASELSWQRFEKVKDIHKVGDKIKAQIFKLDFEKNKIVLSVKKATPCPWQTISETISIGYRQKAKVVSIADFGVFVEIMPGVEALLHKSNYTETPKMHEEILVEIKNIEASKKRMGVLLVNEQKQATEPAQTTEEPMAQETTDSQDNKELEHVG